MSKKKTKKQKQEETQAYRWLLKKRRIGLALYLLFLGVALVGTQGPWWQVVVGENVTFQGPEDHLQSRGVEVEVLNNDDCIRMMRDFILTNPALWYEDIGE